MNENEQLDIKLKTTLVESINDFNRLNNTALTFANTIQKTNKYLDGMGNTKKIITTLTDTTNAANKLKIITDSTGNVLSKTMSNASNNGNKLKSTLGNLFDLNKMYLYWNLTKRLRDGIKSLITSSIDYTETQNKFNVSMGDAKPQAIKFVNTMSEAMGIAKAELMDYQSTFKNILSGLGNFTDSQSEKISESLSKMALDYSSLYNVGQADAMNKFQSALTGSIRPIRSGSGYDVSDTTIGAKAQELGLDRSVNKLNQMEKRILRIIVLMDQMKRTGAMGDLARTIEQPANQLRVLKSQIQECGIWLGNVFMGTIGQILPYINGFVMTLKELLKMLALFTGFVGDDSNLSDVFESVENSTGGVSSNLGTASKKAKELKKTLMGFDVLNVINTPTKSSGGYGGDVGKIDPKILKGLKDYDSIMENVRMKATDIRDRIMEWLGYTKVIDPLTGELSWKLKDGYQNIEKIQDLLKTIGTILLGYKISKSVINFFDNLGLISNKSKTLQVALGISVAISGISLMYKGVKKAIEQGYLDEQTIIEIVSGGGLIAIGGYFTFSKKVNLKVAAGLTIAIASVDFAISAINDYKNGNIKGGALKNLASALGTGIAAKLVGGLALSTSAILSIDVAGIVFLYGASEHGKQTGASVLINTLLKQLGIKNRELEFDINLAIGTTRIVWKGLEKVLPEEKLKSLLKSMILRLADWIKHIPIIGECIGSAIEAGVKASEQDMTNTITYTSKQALKNANPWIKDESEKVGRDTAIAYNEGFDNEKANTSSKLSTSIRDSINSAKENTKNDAFNLGSDTNIRMNEGYNSKKDETKSVIEETIRGSIQNAQVSINNSSEKSGGEAANSWINGLLLNRNNIISKSSNIGTDSGTGLASAFKNKAKVNVDDLLPKESRWSSFAVTASKAFWNNFTSGKVSVNTSNNGTSTLRVQPYSMRAMGGPVPVGEMFLAREAGPELVGRIGNTTTVMNNDQIVTSVSRGVAQAVASVMGNGQSGGSFNFYLDSQELNAVIEKRATRNENIYGTA